MNYDRRNGYKFIEDKNLRKQLATKKQTEPPNS